MDEGGFAAVTAGTNGTGGLRHLEDACMEKTFTVAASDTLNFRWKVSSAGVDYLILKDNGVVALDGSGNEIKISGSTGDWVDVSYTFATAGNHTSWHHTSQNDRRFTTARSRVTAMSMTPMDSKLINGLTSWFGMKPR